MSPRDADEAAGMPADERVMRTRTSDATDAREGATEHLRAALSTAEPAAKQFHVRQALQLLDVEEE